MKQTFIPYRSTKYTYPLTNRYPNWKFRIANHNNSFILVEISLACSIREWISTSFLISAVQLLRYLNLINLFYCHFIYIHIVLQTGSADWTNSCFHDISFQALLVSYFWWFSNWWGELNICPAYRPNNTDESTHSRSTSLSLSTGPPIVLPLQYQ